MMTHGTTAGNAKKVAQLQSIVAEMLAEALRRGFFGTAAVELSVQDGTIQHMAHSINIATVAHLGQEVRNAATEEDAL